MEIKKKFTDMTKQGLWKLINVTSVPEDYTLIGSKWMFEQKKNGV
jgi:hypothetical protein